MARTSSSGSKMLWMSAICLFLLAAPVAASWHNPFLQFFPYYNNGLQLVIRSNCSDIYEHWQENRFNRSNIGPLLLEFNGGSMTSALTDCIIANSPNLVQTKMAAAAIVLGLAPTIIAVLGLRPHDTAVLAVIGNRQILAVVLAVGSPALNAYRMSEFNSVIEDLRQKPQKLPRLVRKFRVIITVVFYLIAAASVANIAELTYRLGSRTIFTIAVDAPWLALVWAFIGIAIHILAAVALRLRVSSETVVAKERTQSWPIEVAQSQVDVILRKQRRTFTVREERFFFSLISLVITLMTACHIIFGTLVFSSIVFVGLNDALLIVLRLMGSAVFCRIIAVYELAALRDSIDELIVPKEYQDTTVVAVNGNMGDTAMIWEPKQPQYNSPDGQPAMYHPQSFPQNQPQDYQQAQSHNYQQPYPPTYNVQPTQ